MPKMTKITESSYPSTSNTMKTAFFLLILSFHEINPHLLPGEIQPPPDQQTTLHDNYVIELAYQNFTFNIIGPEGCRDQLDIPIEKFFGKKVPEFKDINPDSLSTRGIIGYIRVFYETCDMHRSDFVINTWYDVPAITSNSHLGFIRSLESLFQMQFRLDDRLFMNQTVVKMNNLSGLNLANLTSRQISNRL